MSQPRYRCLIVDDEALGRELIESHVGQLKQFELVGSCASAIEASQLLNSKTIDLLFLDIEMPVIKGTDFYRSLSNRPKVIFTTAYRDYALDGFDLEAVDYLLKPITFARFFKAIDRFLASQRAGQPSNDTPPGGARDSLVIRADRKDIRLMLADINYVQGLKDYIKIHTRYSVHIVKETMTSIGQRLGSDFVRVHRSYLVNRRRVTALTRHDVEIGDIEIPIGDKYRQAALGLLS